MAEQRNGYVCKRNDGQELVGHDGTFIQWNTLEELAAYCRPVNPSEQILGAVTYIGPDAPQNRDRPTCLGVWLDRFDIVWDFSREIPDSPTYTERGPWFGPRPNPPEVTT